MPRRFSASAGPPSANDSPPRPVRLAYELSLTSRSPAVRLLPRLKPDGPFLSEPEVKELLPQLHALDQAIVRELRSGLVFGQIGDGSLARLLPLLAQRATVLNGERMVVSDEPVWPRARVEAFERNRLQLVLGLASSSQPWIDIREGRLVAGAQAYFIRLREILPVESPAPWELSDWAKTPAVGLSTHVTPAERDAIVKRLLKAGVPEEDLEALAVRRGPPDRFVVRFLAPDEEGDEAIARVALEAEYAGARARIAGAGAGDVYLVSPSTRAGVIERDLSAEDLARKRLRRVGFRFDRANDAFVAKKQLALRALDPHSAVFPEDWIIDRTAHPVVFRRDLNVSAEVLFRQDEGLLDVQVDVEAIDEDAETVAALVELKELIAWLQTGRDYVRLPDGSFVAPSQRFRHGLRVIDDLGADSGRALVSPLCAGLLRALGDGAAVRAADDATRAWLDEVAGNRGPRSIEPPGDLGTILRDYQHRGFDWLAMLHRHRLTGILADDMGLGKTLQTLALLSYVREREGPKPSLVVAPTSVVSVWRDEAEKFVPGLRVALWHGPPSERHAIAIDEHDLIVTSYGILRRDAEKLSKQALRYAILDEAQSAKNATTQNAKAIRRLKSERRLALTGTPVENRPEELWAIFDFLAPGFLGNLRRFRKRYGRPISQGNEEALAVLRARIQPLVLRRLKAEVAKELPPKIESTVRCQMLSGQRALYDHIAGRLRESVREKIERVGIERAQLDILAALTRLRQICCDPSLLPAPKGTKVPGSAKLELFEELMREALNSERRVVVFSQFVQMQKRLIAVIKRLGVEPLWLHGGTRNRDRVIDAFQTPSGPPVIVVSLKAGGTGLTLTRADTVMHYDPWWNPAVERQATDRTHRLGQTQQVTVYKLVCAGSIEERVVTMAEKKDALAGELLGSEGKTGAKQISVDEVLSLLH